MNRAHTCGTQPNHAKGGAAVRRISWAGLVTLVALHVTIGLYGINQPLRWGHYGFHVAEHGLGARNLNRWGTWEFTTFYGLGRPPVTAYNFHHAARLHIPLALMHRLFGDAPWTARILSVLLGCVTVAGVYLFARRARGELQGFLAAGLFVFSPIHVAYANLADIQTVAIGAMFWFGYFAQGLALGPSRRQRIGLLAAGAVGGFADWAWYPILCLTAAVLLVVARPWRRDDARPADDTARYLRNTLWMFAGVSVAIVAQHFLRAWHYGVLHDLTNTYGQRSGGLGVFVRDFLFQRLTMNHTVPVLVATALWPLVVYAQRRRDVGTVIVASYLVGQTLYMFKFPTEFCAHEYRSYLFAAPMAFAASEVVLPAGRLARRWFREPESLVPSFETGAVFVALFAQVPTAYFMADLSRERAGSTSTRAYDAHHGDTIAAEVIRAMSSPEGIVLLGPGAPYDRIEVPFLFNRLARYATTPEEARVQWSHGSVILFTDEAHVVAPEWRRIMQGARIVLLDGRAIVDLTPARKPSVEEMRWSVPELWSPVQRFFYAPMRGPVLVRAGNAEHARDVALTLGLDAPTVTAAAAGRTPALDALPASLKLPTTAR